MSRRKDEDDENQENLMILRLPEKYAQTVRQAVSKGNLRERLEIDIKEDCRNALLKIGKEILPARVVDLPCIVECQKTVDNKTFYKSGDICQMLLVGDTPLDPEEAAKSQQRRKDKVEYKKYTIPHGITPPLKNVRKKRFRKTAPKKIIDDPEVEKEVRRLLRADISAISVETKIVYDDPQRQAASTANQQQPANKSSASTGAADPAPCDLSKMLDETLTGTISLKQEEDEDKTFSKELLEMFQELSSEESSDEDIKDEVLPMKVEETTAMKSIIKPMETSASTSQEALYHLETLDRKIASLEVEVARTTNTFLKARLQDDLNNLKKERASKMGEFG